MFKKKIPYAVELDGTISLHQNGNLHTLTNLKEIQGDCLVVTDFQDAMARTMTVEADTRYVELMISKKLQETGEFDEPVTVITHWKKRRGKNMSDIFFTALPAKRYFQYVELVSEHPDHLVVLPLQSTLFSVLKKYSKGRPIAAIIQHGRFADVLVGTSSKIWYANRVVAYDQSEEQVAALWETVRADIETAGTDHRQAVEKIYVATWVDSGPLPQWSAEGDLQIIPLTEHTLLEEEQERRVSLPALIQNASMGTAVASVQDKLFCGARRMLPTLNILLIIAALAMGALGFGLNMQSTQRKTKIQTIHSELVAMRAKAPQKVEQVPYTATLAFVEQLWSSRQFPTYQKILADIGKGVEGTLQVENIKADYTGDKVKIRAYGTAHAPFEVSYKAYQALRQRLTHRGYEMLDERFDTEISDSSFVLHFAKEIR